MGSDSALQSVNQSVMAGSVKYSVAFRVQALTLLTLGGKSLREVSDLLNIPQRTLSHMKATAFARGFNPDIDLKIKEEYVADAARSGRLKEISADMEQKLIDSVTMDRNG
ncbi:hypothetical protein KEM56_006270 [Ascosphaera pollenicola]|nr:hypothetical protein KEM56_006270 [Ascosphaera pollenicola]